MSDVSPILGAVEGSDLYLDPPSSGSPPPPPGYDRQPSEGIWAAGDRVTWVSGLVLALSSFMGWYSGSGLGVKLAVLGWHTGTIGKLVFFIGLAVVVLVGLRAYGFDLPASIPESLVVLGLGALATVFVLIRVISVPDAVLPADSRGIGLWISLAAALGVIAGGLIRAAEDL
jgi:hypothetical protein